MLDFDWVKHLTLRMVTFYYAFESALIVTLSLFSGSTYLLVFIKKS
jgi:hypothetical protein